MNDQSPAQRRHTLTHAATLRHADTRTYTHMHARFNTETHAATRTYTRNLHTQLHGLSFFSQHATPAATMLDVAVVSYAKQKQKRTPANAESTFPWARHARVRLYICFVCVSACARTMHLSTHNSRPLSLSRQEARPRAQPQPG